MPSMQATCDSSVHPRTRWAREPFGTLLHDDEKRLVDGSRCVPWSSVAEVHRVASPQFAEDSAHAPRLLGTFDAWAKDPACSLHVLLRSPGLVVDIQGATCD
jgi:hypothetical protein